MYSWPDCQYTVFATYRCPYTGSYATALNLQNFCFGYFSWKFHSMMSVPNILGVTQDENYGSRNFQNQFSICQEANGQFCNVYALLQLLANLPSCITALNAKNAASISTRCSLQVRKTQSISIPSSITLNVWILTSAPSTVTTAITLI